MGPYIVKDISSSGAIKVATLEGGELSNWISGCRIKKYLEPLTQEMLQQIHNAKKLEHEKQRVIKEAKDEAQVRILRRKQQQEGRLPRIPLQQITCIPTTAPEEMTKEVQHAT